MSKKKASASDAVTTVERARALRIAAKAGCDWRTALRGMREGVDKIRTLSVREAVASALLEEQ